ncbi:hypothetical protein HID58_032914 [Brassica napus]|uniref:Yippee domain-containing protein n=1 Tax=Brassica napus TaxID=3708 RepID=A0ABQ8BYX8_BRANA|nr:hypothetical protein HID58_032914 [Brassica napus]
MGRVFLIEKEEPAFTCTTCNAQIALGAHLLDDFYNLFEFYQVYNVMVGEDVVPYGNDLYYGYEVSCVNCCTDCSPPPPPPPQNPPDVQP